jgi:hypothetical protein
MSIDHRAEALRLAEESRGVLRPNDEGPCEADRLLAEAQIHATLARDEEQTATTADLRDALALLRRRESAVRELVATHILEALASQESARRMAALHLTRDLHEAGANVDDLINAQAPEGGWEPFSTPTDDPWTKAEKAAAREPWGPGVTRDQAMADVVVLHLAEAFLDGKSEEVRVWARGLAHELRREQIDLIDEIGRHMQRMALGGPTNEVPF